MNADERGRNEIIRVFRENQRPIKVLNVQIDRHTTG